MRTCAPAPVIKRRTLHARRWRHAGSRTQAWPATLAPIGFKNILAQRKRLMNARPRGRCCEPLLQLRPPPPPGHVAHRDGDRLLLAHQHDELLAPGDAGVE